MALKFLLSVGSMLLLWSCHAECGEARDESASAPATKLEEFILQSCFRLVSYFSNKAEHELVLTEDESEEVLNNLELASDAGLDLLLSGTTRESNLLANYQLLETMGTISKMFSSPKAFERVQRLIGRHQEIISLMNKPEAVALDIWWLYKGGNFKESKRKAVLLQATVAKWNPFCQLVTALILWREGHDVVALKKLDSLFHSDSKSPFATEAGWSLAFFYLSLERYADAKEVLDELVGREQYIGALAALSLRDDIMNNIPAQLTDLPR